VGGKKFSDCPNGKKFSTAACKFFFVAMMRKNLLFYYGKQSEKFVGFN
jgi:hypothetical protein